MLPDQYALISLNFHFCSIAFAKIGNSYEFAKSKTTGASFIKHWFNTLLDINFMLFNYNLHILFNNVRMK